jgi:hypothetical protein
MDDKETNAQRNASHYWGTVDPGSDFWTKLLGKKETWLLVDLHRGDDYTDRRQACKIVLTSTLRGGDWPDLDSGGGTMSKKLYMAPLSLLEAKSLRAALSLPLDEEEIARRFGLFGGSARFLFHAGGQSKVDEAFRAGVKIALDPNSDNPVLTSALVHIIADESFEYVGRKFASHAIAVRAVDALIDLKEVEEKEWMEATQGKNGKQMMGARSIFAERLWHRAVNGDEKKIRLKMLLPKKRSETVVMNLTKSFSRTRRFSKADLSDLTNMTVGEYCLPDNDQFPDIDAIAVLEPAPWQAVSDEADEETDSSEAKDEEKSSEAKEEAPSCIGIMLQMAVGGGHKSAQGKTLVDIDKKMGDLVEGYTSGENVSPLCLIYVTEKADGWTYRPYVKKEEGKSGGTVYQKGRMPKALNKIKQFAMSFPKLSEL